MITIGYSTRKENPKFKEYLQKTCMYKEIQVIEKVNNGDKNLSQVYNEILSESKFDIVVLCHDDIEFDTKNWGDKLLKIFDKNKEFGIIGLAGTTHMPKSGMWWEDRTKMYGIVNHKHNGKVWESKYAPSLNDIIKEVVVVDGLFIAINKTKIKETFDESVEGFHMYDINFCFKNFLSDVKLGVTTLIRVTHLSIGQTNDTWESNRKIFVEKYNDKLPVRVKLNENQKLNILISCLLFQNFTGSEMYVYELAKNLVKDNCDVTILAYETTGPLVNLATKLGVKVLNAKEAPGYKLGDGKWAVLTENGYIQSVPNTLYKTSDVHYDIIHCQHKPMVEMMVNLYPTIDKICTIHSEVISLEEPVKHDSIKKYIAIRPEIKNHLVNYFEIDENDITVIYNPIDETKFRIKDVKTNNNILFVGTVDYLRKQTIFDLIEYSKNNNKELWLVGKNQSDYLNDVLNNSHVKYFPQRSNIEEMVYSCDETAGILLGRTTIEGWMCGKSGWIYDVSSNGNIISKKLTNPPVDIEKFYSRNVIRNIKQEYFNTLNYGI